MLRTILLVAGITTYRREERFATFVSSTDGCRPGLARPPGHYAAFIANVPFHADIWILPWWYSDRAVAQWTARCDTVMFVLIISWTLVGGDGEMIRAETLGTMFTLERQKVYE